MIGYARTQREKKQEEEEFLKKDIWELDKELNEYPPLEKLIQKNNNLKDEVKKLEQQHKKDHEHK